MHEQEFGELIQMVKEVRSDVKEIKDDIKTQNGRVRRLEDWRNFMVGIGVILVFAIPLILKYLF